MSSQTSFGSNMLFQTINDDLNASLATADELSREFSSLLNEASSNSDTTTLQPKTSSSVTSEWPESTWLPNTNQTRESSFSSNIASGTLHTSNSLPSFDHLDKVFYSNTNAPSSPDLSKRLRSSPISHRQVQTAVPRAKLETYSYSQHSPIQSQRHNSLGHESLRRDSSTHDSPRHVSPRCNSPKHNSPDRYDRSPRGSIGYADKSPLQSPSAIPSDPVSHFGKPHSSSSSSSSSMLSPYDNSTMGRRSPRPEKNPSPLSFNSQTLPRNFGFRPLEQGVQTQKNPSKWNETDLDKSYERKPHHTYDKTEWLRPSVPNSSWRESDLDGPSPAPSPNKNSRTHQLPHGSLPRNTRTSMPPDLSSQGHGPYHSQPILSRISIPPTSTESRHSRPIPLSVILRLQNPHWKSTAACHPSVMGGEGEMPQYNPVVPIPREFYYQPMFLSNPREPRQPTIYNDVLNPADIDAELERLDYIHPTPVILERPSKQEGGQSAAPAPRPLSPTRLQPVVAPEAQMEAIPNLEELLRVRAEIPRALKRRGSVEPSNPMKRALHYQPNQYKSLINKLFSKKVRRPKGERGSETSSSSDGEDFATPPAPFPQTSPLPPHDFASYHSILRRSNRERKGRGNRARLSPLVLLLDGALVGELETVQKAVQEMNDPSQPNDEGITALHNAICGGHYNVVDFLVCIGANVSAPDSHGWTPLHCAASCNDRPLCEFLVRNGAAVMAMTESDGAIASQKCDPYAVGFEECESFLKGVEAAMGAENSGVLYALWSYPAQAADELSFKEGDMVTILQKPEGSAWWWASLCGREGLVPNNYFGLFPKVRPKSLC